MKKYASYLLCGLHMGVMLHGISIANAQDLANAVRGGRFGDDSIDTLRMFATYVTEAGGPDNPASERFAALAEVAPKSPALLANFIEVNSPLIGSALARFGGRTGFQAVLLPRPDVRAGLQTILNGPGEKPLKVWTMAEVVKFLRRGVKVNLQQVEATIGGISQKALTILSVQIGMKVDIDYGLIDELASALGVSQGEAFSVASLYRQLGGRSLPLLTSDEWDMSMAKTMSLIRERLGKNRSQKVVAEMLWSAPVLVFESFHNTVMMTGRDRPRESRRELIERLHVGRGRTSRLVDWEAFWRGIIKAQKWEEKPAGMGRLHRVGTSISYATKAHWSMHKFRTWLEGATKGTAEEYIFKLFCEVIDFDVIDGRRAIAATRASFPALAKNMGGRVCESALAGWARVFETLAGDLGVGQAVRKPANYGMTWAGRRVKVSEYRDIFKKASMVKGNKARALYDGLLDAGFRADAMVVANVVVGVNDGPRLTTNNLHVGYSIRGAYNVERRVTEHAQKFGFALKEPVKIKRDGGPRAKVGGGPEGGASAGGGKAGGVLDGARGFASAALPFVAMDVAEHYRFITHKDWLTSGWVAGMTLSNPYTPAHLLLLMPPFELGGMATESIMDVAGARDGDTLWRKLGRTVGGFAGAALLVKATGGAEVWHQASVAATNAIGSALYMVETRLLPAVRYGVDMARHAGGTATATVGATTALALGSAKSALVAGSAVMEGAVGMGGVAVAGIAVASSAALGGIIHYTRAFNYIGIDHEMLEMAAGDVADSVWDLFNLKDGEKRMPISVRNRHTRQTPADNNFPSI